MDDTYKTVFKDNDILQKDKGSKFIAKLFHVERLENVQEIMTSLKKDFYDANHHCSAYRFSENDFHYSDDGEPSNTAGKPIYEVIAGANLVNVLIVVIRYFGGTKLGTGGLIRAYGSAAKEVIESAEIEEVILRESVSFIFAYDDTNTVMHCINQFDCKIIEQKYSDQVEIFLEIRLSELKSFAKMLFESSNGKLKLEI